MKNTIRLSTIALLAAALAVTPASALTINLGGNEPLVQLGGSDDSGAAVSVETDDLLGGSGGGILGGSDGGGSNDTNATVDLDLGNTTGAGTGTLLDLGGSSGGQLLDFGDGYLLDLSGNDETDAVVDLDLTSTGGIGETGNLLDLGGSGRVLSLTGTSGDEDVLLDLGNTDVVGDVNLENDDDPTARVDLIGNDGVARSGLLRGTDGLVTLGGDNAATISLSDSGDDGTGGDGTGTGSDGGDGTGNGGDGDGDGAGNAGAASAGSNTAGTMAASSRTATNTTARTNLRANAGATACLDVGANQIGQLVDRHTYDEQTFKAWADARSMKIVEVDICDRAVAQVETALDGSANIARLQAFLASQAKVRAGLQSTGYTTNDVIAADDGGDTLIVYVTSG